MRVTANGKSVEVFVTDSMGGDEYDLNLPTEAFEKISGQNSGVIDVTWEWIECPVKYSDLHYHFQENSNENYFAFQVIDHKFKVEKIELKINSHPIIVCSHQNLILKKIISWDEDITSVI